MLRDLREVDCQILTIGQYLRPSLAHIPMDRYYTPDEFRDFKRIALDACGQDCKSACADGNNEKGKGSATK